MTLNRISSSCFYDKMQGNKEQQTSKLSTEQAFLNRYNSKDTGEVSDPVLEETSRTNCLSTSILLHNSGRLSIQATVECSARHISYDEADHVKTFVKRLYFKSTGFRNPAQGLYRKEIRGWQHQRL